MQGTYFTSHAPPDAQDGLPGTETLDGPYDSGQWTVSKFDEHISPHPDFFSRNTWLSCNLRMYSWISGCKKGKSSKGSNFSDSMMWATMLKKRGTNCFYMERVGIYGELPPSLSRRTLCAPCFFCNGTRPGKLKCCGALARQYCMFRWYGTFSQTINEISSNQ